MNTTDFIRISKNSRKPEFKELIGLSKSNKTSELIDFCFLAHPKADCKEFKGSEGKIKTKDNVYFYTLYSNCIVRHNEKKGIKDKIYFL